MTSIRHISSLEGDPAVDLSADPLLSAARDVIMTHGPRRATLTEVARQAGVSRMTVYRRFESFDRLISALLTAELRDVLAGIPLPGSGAGSARDQAVGLVVATTDAIADHPLVRRVLAVDPEYLTPLMVQRFGQTQRSAIDLLAPLLAAGMASQGGDGSIRDTDPAALSLACVTAVQSFIFAAPALADRAEGPGARAELPFLVAGLLRPTPLQGEPS
jgi:AcrR family transcriptional regulator